MSVDRPDQQLGSKSLWNLITMGVILAQGLVLSVLSARLLTESEFARLIYANWVIGTASVLALAGLPAVLMRYLPETLARASPGVARRLLDRLSLIGLTALVLAALLVAWLGRAGWLALGALTALAAVAAVAHGLSQLAMQSLQSIGRQIDVARAASLAALVAVPATLWLLLSGAGVAALIALGLLLNAATALWWQRRARVRLAAAGEGRPPEASRLLRFGLPLSALVLVDQVVWQRSELYFLGLWSPKAELAIYGVAFLLANALVRMGPTALSVVLTPAFAYLHGAERSDAQARLQRQASRALLLASGPPLVLALAGAPALLLLWGPWFLRAWLPLAILALGFAAGNVAGAAAGRLHGADRGGLLLACGSLTALVNIALDLLLIRQHGALGAAVACAAAQLLSLPLLLWAARRVGASAPARLWWPLTAVTLSAAAGLALSRLLVERSDPLAAGTLAAGAGLALLALLLRALRCWEPAEQLQLSRALRHLPGSRELVRLLTGLDSDPVREQRPASGAPARPLASVVIPTRNRRDFLEGCLESLRSHVDQPIELIVVDSSDDDAAWELLERYPEVLGLRIPGGRDNRHAAKNAGLAHARAEVVCFLDDDSRVSAGWLERHLSHYRDPRVGAVGGRIIDANFGAPDPEEDVGALRWNGHLTLNFTRHTGQPVAIRHAIGCNLSFRRRALQEVAGFDLHYGGPNLMEETDLCLRVGRDYRVLFDPDALVEHVNAPRDTGMRRQALDPRLELWTARSRGYFTLKLLPLRRAVVRYSAGSFLAHHLRAGLGGEPGHLRAALLQACGLVLGAADWLAAGCPRQPVELPPEPGSGTSAG